MDRKMRLFSILAACASLGACATQGHSVIASTVTVIGFEVAQQPTNGTIQSSFGYRRAEFAFVPTNRNATDVVGSEGAADSADVLMELHYTGKGTGGQDNGIYQRLAVGKNAVAASGAAVMFAKAADGMVDQQTTQAMAAIAGIPPTDTAVGAALRPLSTAYRTAKNDAAAKTKFDTAAKALGEPDFKTLLKRQNLNITQVQQLIETLKNQGIAIN